MWVPAQITTVGGLAGRKELWSTMFHADVDMGIMATGKKLRTAQLAEVACPTQYSKHPSHEADLIMPVALCVG